MNRKNGDRLLFALRVLTVRLAQKVACPLFCTLLACAPPAADPCDPNPCSDPGRTVCQDSDGAALCSCDEGLREVAGACVPPDPCDPNPCTVPNQSVCSAVAGGTFTCACDPGFIPDFVGCRIEPPITCENQHTDGDLFEPDECPALARDIDTTGSQWQAHSVFPADDADWIRVDALAHQVFAFNGDPSSPLTLKAEVYSTDALLPVGGVHTAPTPGQLLFLTEAPAAGPLYFRIRGADPAAVGDYDLSLRSAGIDESDTTADAAPIQLDTIVRGELHDASDIDVGRFTAEAGHSYRVRTASTTAPRGPLWLRLLRGSPPFVRREASGFTVEMLFRSSTAEPYWVSLSQAPGGYASGWTLSVDDLGPDDHGDDPLDSALTFATGQPHSASIERIGDKDVIRFDATSGRIYAFNCSPSGFTNCAVTLLDGSGSVIGADYARLVHEFVPGGVHYFVVEAPGGAIGDYTWSLEDLGVDDYGDSVATATTISLPPEDITLDPCLFMSNASKIETTTDKDVLAFTVYADHVIRFRCVRGTLADCNLRLLDANGAQLVADTDGGDGIAWIEDVGGQTYHLELSSPSGIGGYTWSILDVCHDDHGDDLAHTTLMSANSAFVTGELEMPTDVDAYRFVVQAGINYRVSCTRQTLGDCHLKLYDGSGTLLDSDVDGLDAVVTKQAAASGEFRFEISGAGGTGTFLVKAEDLGP